MLTPKIDPLLQVETCETLLYQLQHVKPGMVEELASKTMAWEKERWVEFLYDGIRLLSRLEEYTILQQEKEQERRRLQDQKKLQGQLMAEQEPLYGSKPSPSKPQSVKKGPRYSTGGASNKRVSLGGAMVPAYKPDSLHSAKATPKTRPSKKSDHLNHCQDDGIPAFSAVRRGLDIAETLRKHSSTPRAVNGKEPESPLLVRKPFSPISSAVSSKANMTNMLEVEDNGETSHKMLHPSNDLSHTTTPLKTIPSVDEENRTPKALPIIPSTPSTLSVPMQTAMRMALPLAPIPFAITQPVEEKLNSRLRKQGLLFCFLRFK